MNDKRILLLVTFALIASIAASVFVLYNRIIIEKQNNIVEIAVDYSDIERLAFIDNIAINTILLKLKTAGATSIALTEDLANNTDINLLSGIDPKKLDLYIQSKGLSSGKQKVIKDSGLRVIPRIRNSFNMSAGLISKKIKGISSYDTVIFAEEEVLGYPNYIKESAKALASAKIRYGFIEFGKQLGDEALSAFSGRNIVKVHSIPQEEMGKMSRADMVQRFMRAVRERSIRVLYVHLIAYPDNGKDLLKTNTDLISLLKAELIKNSFETGKASIPGHLKINNIERGFIALGIASASILLSSYFIPMNLLTAIAIFIVFIVLSSVKILALISAIIFPVYAVIAMFPVKWEKTNFAVISNAVSMIMYVAGITVVGGVFIASLLAGANTFSGVKAALVLPIIVIAAHFLFRNDENGKFDMKTSINKLNELINLNIKASHVAVFVLVATAGALFILRSGNFGIPVSGAEKFARNLLENILVVRPRTKEFLLGYPAITLAAIYYLKGGNKWLWLFLAVGSLGPISMINSFCHYHTPFFITLVRSCVGLVLGIAIGIMIYFAYVLWELIWSKAKVYIK